MGCALHGTPQSRLCIRGVRFGAAFTDFPQSGRPINNSAFRRVKSNNESEARRSESRDEERSLRAEARRALEQSIEISNRGVYSLSRRSSAESNPRGEDSGMIDGAGKTFRGTVPDGGRVSNNFLPPRTVPRARIADAFNAWPEPLSRTGGTREHYECIRFQSSRPAGTSRRQTSVLTAGRRATVCLRVSVRRIAL